MKDYQGIINQAIGKRDILRSQAEQLARRIVDLKCDVPAIERAQVLLQNTASETQNQLRVHLEDIVNTGLETCFPESYTAHIDFLNKRGKIECDIYLKDYSGNRVDPLEDNGGGLADIVSFSLRMACWAIGNTDNVIILDEPFKFLSKELRPLAGNLLKDLSSKLGIQIIMVTHDEEMIAASDKVFTVRKNKDGVSEVREGL